MHVQAADEEQDCVEETEVTLMLFCNLLDEGVLSMQASAGVM